MNRFIAGFLAAFVVLGLCAWITTSYILPKYIKKQTQTKREEIKQRIGEALRNAIEKRRERMQERAVTATTTTTTPAEAPKGMDPKTPDEINIVGKQTAEGLAFFLDAIGNCSLRVETQPTNALVTVNGKLPIGRTPVLVRGECNKSFQFTFENDQYEKAERTLTLKDTGNGVAIRMAKIAAPAPTSAPSKTARSPFDVEE